MIAVILARTAILTRRVTMDSIVMVILMAAGAFMNVYIKTVLMPQTNVGTWERAAMKTRHVMRDSFVSHSAEMVGARIYAHLKHVSKAGQLSVVI